MLNVHKGMLMEEDESDCTDKVQQKLRTHKCHLGGPYYARRMKNGCVKIEFSEDHEEKEDSCIGYQGPNYTSNSLLGEIQMDDSDSDNEIDSIDAGPITKRSIARQLKMFDCTQYECIDLTPMEFNTLMGMYEEMEACCSELRSVFPCFVTHENQMGYFQCLECNPSGKGDH
jgi:hypothetical protein